MKLRMPLLIAVSAVNLTCSAARIDLSQYTDLSDRKDDAVAFAKAVEDAGDGGMVYIPAGIVILKAPVRITNHSISIVGDGVAVTKIEPGFSDGRAALAFVSTADNTAPTRWVLSDVRIGAGNPNVGAALKLTDERGVKGDARMKISNVRFLSSTRNYFARSLIINGMTSVDIETSNFVGELRDSPGEKRGRLTRSHISLQGEPSGKVSLFLCHLRMVQHHIELMADFEQLYLRQLNMVQCDSGIYHNRPERTGKWLYMHGCALQLDTPLAVHSVADATISSSRFIVKTKSKVNPCIRMEGVTASLVSGNFLHNNGIHYQDSIHGVAFGNHAYEGGGEIQLTNSKHFALCNNYSQGGSGKAANTLTTLGNCKHLMLSVTEEVR